MTNPPHEKPDHKQQTVLTVSQLNQSAKTLLESHFSLVWVSGEISNLAQPASGHAYFSLKDGHAQIRCALFRGQRRHLDCEPQDGMQVLVRARVTLYEARGDYQLIVQQLQESGEGALRRAFEELKKRLSSEGLFDQDHKQQLPSLPRRIGVISSATGAAIRDIVSTLRRRFPAIPVLLYPVPVQGQGAAEEIAQAIRLAVKRRDCDVLLLARGGGSLEDLWAFNEEILAQAIYDCPIPLICGVGHEVDFTIADLVADQRAPTPTAAAELVSPDQQALTQTLAHLTYRLHRYMGNRLSDLAQRLDWLSERIVHPSQRIAIHKQRLADLAKRLGLATRFGLHQRAGVSLELSSRLRECTPGHRLRSLAVATHNASHRLHRAIRMQLERTRHRTETKLSRLNDISPLATLQRGYAVLQTPRRGQMITQSTQIKPGDQVEARLAKGRLWCTVDRCKDD
ncbi:MAG TPA: exodeoxyribonuclease VII large subunit [Acidiferrobacteraceae bacterium]|nr:exodeoxyribonuclease VII large subunit [Acidiferrobacteraceae bacterium]